MRGYLVQPTGQGPFPSVLIIHENCGLNPYIEDVARRAAVEGFLALAPETLAAGFDCVALSEGGRCRLP